jgi:hypothetical protein
MPSITPTTTSTPSTQSFITLEVVLTAYTYRLTLTAFSRTALAKRPGPRSMPAEQLAPEGILRITLDAWGGEETAQLLFGDALLDKGKLAAPTQLPLSAAADATAPAAALVVAPIEDVVLLAGQWAYNSPDVDFSAAARGRGVPPSSETFLVHRAAASAVYAAGLFSPSATPSATPSPSRAPFAGMLGALALLATPFNSPPSGDLLAPTGLT